MNLLVTVGTVTTSYKTVVSDKDLSEYVFDLLKQHYKISISFLGNHHEFNKNQSKVSISFVIAATLAARKMKESVPVFVDYPLIKLNSQKE
jgi:ribulose bisphosphate carboxylase small subunit